GRKIAYSRLRATDAAGKELPVRIEAHAPRSDAFTLHAPTVKLLVLVNDADAVYPVRVDPTFSDANWISLGNIPGADSGIYAAVADGSGNLYIGGQFMSVGGVSVNRIAKWDGSSWSALGSGVNSGVLALAVSGSDVYAGGAFTTAINGDGIAVTVNYIAKWDGTRNSW